MFPDCVMSLSWALLKGSKAVNNRMSRIVNEFNVSSLPSRLHVQDKSRRYAHV